MFRLMADFNNFSNQSVSSLHNGNQLHNHHLNQSNTIPQFQPNHNLMNTQCQNYAYTAPNSYFDDPYTNKKTPSYMHPSHQIKNPNRNKKVKDLILDLRMQQHQHQQPQPPPPPPQPQMQQMHYSQQQQQQQQQQQVHLDQQYQSYYYESDIPHNSITLNCLNNNQHTSNQSSLDLIQLLNSTNTTIDETSYQSPLSQYQLASEDDISSLSSTSSLSSNQHFMSHQHQQHQQHHQQHQQHQPQHQLHDIVEDCSVAVNLCEPQNQDEDNFLYNILNKINTQNDKLILLSQDFESASNSSPSSSSSSANVQDDKLMLMNQCVSMEEEQASATYATLQPATGDLPKADYIMDTAYMLQSSTPEPAAVDKKDAELSVDCAAKSAPSVPSPTNSQMEEINTKELAHKISSELKRYSIPQAVFAQRVLCRSQGTLSDLLRNPKPWSKLKSGRETFRRMYKWLQEPESHRMNALRQAAAVKRKDEDEDEDEDADEENVDDEDDDESEEEEESVKQSRMMQINQIIIDHQMQNQSQQQQPAAAQPSQSGHHAKKPRLVFTDIQRRTLQAIFKETKRPSKEMQVTIAQQLGLEVATVSNFFMNARRRSMDKWKDQDDENSNCSIQK